MLNGTTLTKENRIKYLGAILGNDGSATHVAQRVKAANGSYFKLQAAGMHGGGLSPDAIRHMSGDSLASMFYWTIYKRGDTEGKTLMGRSHTILQQYGLTLNKAIFNDIFRINNKTVIYEKYSYGQNGLVDSLRAIFNDYTFDSKRYAQMLLRF